MQTKAPISHQLIQNTQINPQELWQSPGQFQSFLPPNQLTHKMKTMDWNFRWSSAQRQRVISPLFQNCLRYPFDCFLNQAIKKVPSCFTRNWMWHLDIPQWHLCIPQMPSHSRNNILHFGSSKHGIFIYPLITIQLIKWQTLISHTANQVNFWSKKTLTSYKTLTIWLKKQHFFQVLYANVWG